MYTTLTPRLVVSDVDAAIAFYQAVLEAVPGMRLATPDGVVVHAEIDVAGLRMSLTQATGPESQSPLDLGGSPVLLTLMCDPDAVAARAVAHGAELVFPVDDRFYGMRDGRFRDPFGHLWLVTRTLEHLDEGELNKRTAEVM